MVFVLFLGAVVRVFLKSVSGLFNKQARMQRQAGKQARRQVGKQASEHAGRQVGGRAGRQASKHACTHSCTHVPTRASKQRKKGRPFLTILKPGPSVSTEASAVEPVSASHVVTCLCVCQTCF